MFLAVLMFLTLNAQPRSVTGSGCAVTAARPPQKHGEEQTCLQTLWKLNLGHILENDKFTTFMLH